MGFSKKFLLGVFISYSPRKGFRGVIHLSRVWDTSQTYPILYGDAAVPSPLVISVPGASETAGRTPTTHRTQKPRLTPTQRQEKHQGRQATKPTTLRDPKNDKP